MATPSMGPFPLVRAGGVVRRKASTRRRSARKSLDVTRRKPYPLLAFAIFALLGTAGLAGCPSTTTTTYTPITGIEIDSASLVGEHGCGTGPDQVYMYAAVLSYSNGEAGPGPADAYSGVFDCYSNALFSNLPADDAGSTSFDISVFAYNQQAFSATTLQCPGVELEAGAAYPLCPGDRPAAVESYAGNATWTTTCTATQQSGSDFSCNPAPCASGVTVLAVCQPLVATAGAPEGGPVEAAPTAGMPITVATAGFVAPDGGTFDCSSSFTSAQASYGAGSQLGTVSVTACPGPLTISPTIAGATYTITVQLLQGSVAVGTVACQAQASATSPTQATCGPVTIE